MTAKLTKKMRDALVLLREGPQTVYELSGSLFNERYGLCASRAGGRLQTLKRQGFVRLDGKIWRITEVGRRALAGGDDG
jgi:predicted transcriptional regulator